MPSRRAVLLTPPKSFHPSQLLSRRQSVPISPLAATLINLPASVANKRLTAGLNPVDATLTKSRGYILQARHLSLSSSLLSSPLPPIFRTHFQVPYPGSPLLAALTKTAGVCTNNSHSGTRHSPLVTRHCTQVLSFHILAHSFAPTKNSTLLFSSNSALFAKNHPGWGRVCRASSTFRRSDLRTFRRA
jgi:hypothetical protein